MHHAGSRPGAPADLPAPVQRPSPITGDDGAWHAKALRAWLLALLRLSITGDRADRLEVMAFARALDALGTPPPDLPVSEFPTFRFFHTTSTELCHALADRMHPRRDHILRRHIARIEDRRLKLAFAAAVETAHPAAQPIIKTESHASNGRPR